MGQADPSCATGFSPCHSMNWRKEKLPGSHCSFVEACVLLVSRKVSAEQPLKCLLLSLNVLRMRLESAVHW